MEFLLLLTIAGAVAWLWNRMVTLERRVIELEGLAHVYSPEWRKTADERPESLGTPFEAEEAAPPLPPLASSLPKSGPAPEPATAEPADDHFEEPSEEEGHRWRTTFDFEQIFGRLLPIWGGGIALAIAGFFLVRWSIEMGLLNEYVRVGLGFVFGSALLAAAELAYRFENRIGDERVRQALAGAGLATLYASFYLAGTYYGLVGPALAFAGLAGVTAIAVLLSFRFGLPSAVLGLVGGFAAPALAGSTDPDLPLLATYLALVTGGLTVTGQRQSRPWLGLAALAFGLGWGALMLGSGPLDDASVLAVGGYLVVIGAFLPSMMGVGLFGQIGRIGAAGLATLQIAALVDQSGYSLLAWGCYLLLGAAIAVLGMKWERLREAGAMAAALSACLLAVWPDPAQTWFAAIAAATVLLFAAIPLLHVWQGKARPIDWAQLALFPIALTVASCIQFDVEVIYDQDGLLALAAAALALLPALAAWKAWPSRDEHIAPEPAGALASAFVLLMLGGLLAVLQTKAPLVTAVLAVAAGLLLRGRSAEPVARILHWAVALSGLTLLAVTSHYQEISSFLGGDIAPVLVSSLRWLAALLPFGLLLNVETDKHPRRVAQFFSALLGYGVLAMLFPEEWLAFALAAAVLGLAWRMGQFGTLLATLLFIGACWAAEPLLVWSVAGVEALLGDPFLLADLPPLPDTLRYVAPLVFALAGGMLLGGKVFATYRKTGFAIAFALVAMVVHTAFKQVFAIGDLARFAELGLAERTAWQALLALVAIGFAAAPQLFAQQVTLARGFAVAALAHFAIFTLLLHNPLWAEQAVGDWPIANLLLPSYGIAIGLTLWLRGQLVGNQLSFRPVFDGTAMVLIALLALSELRHVFAGTVLIDPPVVPQEDLLRSILAIAVALGFLGWGAWARQRSWRIGSLVLMLGAVSKVFFLDAAGLEGLARIASFFALGICLIGIGWFYTRQLIVAEGGDAGDKAVRTPPAA